jgi:hypothetical protein
MDPDAEAILNMVEQLARHNPTKKVLDYGVIQRDLMSLLNGMTLTLERTFPADSASSGAREFFWITFRVALNTYNTIVFICAEKPPDPFRKLEFAISCPPLVRTLADSLFNVVFVLEDIEQRTAWYYRSGWRENQERLARYSEAYGSREEWKEWFQVFTAMQEKTAAHWQISKEERQNPKLIDYWPIPSQIIRFGLKKEDALPDTRAFLQFINDWFYRELSQESHLSYPGLARRGGILMESDEKAPSAQDKLERNRSTQMIMALTLLLALCSEIEQRFNFGFKQRLMVLWGILADALPIPKEVYTARYAKLLG